MVLRSETGIEDKTAPGSKNNAEVTLMFGIEEKCFGPKVMTILKVEGSLNLGIEMMKITVETSGASAEGLTMTIGIELRALKLETSTHSVGTPLNCNIQQYQEYTVLQQRETTRCDITYIP
ncbi:UNVERIFIED_CONTAM: hypothetical protein K2H54_066711 [Gekko kuhli]